MRKFRSQGSVRGGAARKGRLYRDLSKTCPAVAMLFTLTKSGVFMRKYGAMALVAVFVFSLAGCSGGDSVAVVDTTRLFQESESGKAGLAHLQKMESDMQAQLMAAQALLEAKPSDEALRAHFQKEFAGYQGLVQGEQQKVVEGINTQITTALEKARKKGKFAAILPTDGVLAYNPKSDITDDVLKAMNTSPVKFEPVVMKALTPESADAPKTEAATDAPAAASEAPKADAAPATDAPATEAPATEAPKADIPAADAPATEAPKTEAAPEADGKPGDAKLN